jgi:hypothetical protein
LSSSFSSSSSRSLRFRSAICSHFSKVAHVGANALDSAERNDTVVQLIDIGIAPNVSSRIQTCFDLGIELRGSGGVTVFSNDRNSIKSIVLISTWQSHHAMTRLASAPARRKWPE